MYKKAAHYTLVPALRLVNPLTVLARFARLRKGEEDTLGAFLQRDYGPLLGECDVEAEPAASKWTRRRSQPSWRATDRRIYLPMGRMTILTATCAMAMGSRAVCASKTMRRTWLWRPTLPCLP